MTTFCAALRLVDKGPGCAELLSGPMERISYRHGAPGQWVNDPAGLVQMRRPQDGSAGPWQSRSNGPVLCGELVILNGPELAAAAGIAYQSDPLSLLAAYDRWGDDMVHRIEGEFAFVLWDPRARHLLAVRDRFGVKPLAFRVTPQMVLLASEAVALDVAGTQPNPAWIATFLEGAEHCPGVTPFPDVTDVLPGHRLRLAGGTVAQDAWWHLETEPLAERDAPDALAEALDASVRSRIRNPFATLLSGGLDSSAVSCLAARAVDHPIPCISIRHDVMTELDEGPYIESVRNGRNLRAIDVKATIGGSFDDLYEVLEHFGQPIFAPNLAMGRQCYRAAAQSGADVVLDGHGGDEVIGTGEWLFSELAYKRRWRTFFREARVHRAAGRDARDLRHVLLGALATSSPPPVRAVARCLFRDEADTGLPSLVVPHLTTGTEDAHPASAVYLHDHLDPYTRLHARILLNDRTVKAFDFLGNLGRLEGIEPRFPFYDRRVVAIILGQSTEAKIASGQPRALLRKALAGVLPEKVRMRRDKTDFAPSVLASFTPERLAMLADLARDMPEHLREYVAPEALRQILGAFERPETRVAALAPLIRVQWLDCWLRLQSAPKTLKRAGVQ